MYKFLNENNLFSSNQSEFILGDPCIYQLISIAHEIYKSFDEGDEVRSACLNILAWWTLL